MSPEEVLGSGAVLVATVVAGTVAHELSHCAALRAFGVPFEVEWLPDRRDAGLLRASVLGEWATVRPGRVPRGRPSWTLRVSALAPLLLATPLVLILFGVLPDPSQAASVYPMAATVGWLACAIPSPPDFSVAGYAERAVARERPRCDRGDGGG